MASREPCEDISPPDAAALPGLALARPQEALDAARALLATDPGPYAASFAHQAAGIVLRDRGQLPAAVVELRQAARLARAAGRREREADVQATLGVTLAWSGRSVEGLAVLDQAVAGSRGAVRGRVLMRHGVVLYDLGRFDEARSDLSRALALLRRDDDPTWEARTRMLRADVFVGLGLPARAANDWAVAEELFAASGQDLEYAMARHNRGLAALVRGDIPEALAYLDEAGQRYDELGHVNPDLDLDRCRALLAAGLAAEAMQGADAAVARTPDGRGIAYKTAELLLEAAVAARAADDPAAALDRARRAQRLFRAQRRERWQLRAALAVTDARYAAGVRAASLLTEVAELARRLDALGAGDAQHAHLLAGRVALARGDTSAADGHLRRAARTRPDDTALRRSVGLLSTALRTEAHGDGRGTLAAAQRGLDAIDEHLMGLGSVELRAHATTHGAELALLAQREMLRRADARGLLRWSERWRGVALAPRAAGGGPDRTLAAELGALRAVTRMLEVDDATPDRRAALERERRRLEHDVRARSRRVLGARDGAAERFDLEQLVTGLDGTSLVELVEVDGLLHAVTVVNGRVRHHVVGAVPHQAVEMARFSLRRVAYGLAPTRDADALDEDGRQLEEVLLGETVRALGDGPVVVVPTGRLQAVPWTILPSLRERVVSVMPSAATWLRASGRRPPPGRDVTLVVGPGLATDGAEVRQLTSRYADATLLGHGRATADAVLAALDGVWLAHVAAHGRFRADNPLFSSLQLDDGPLTVHDLERLRRAPHQLVLSSCDSGVAAPVGADELLGLVSALVPLGATGIVASIVPVNDAAVVPIMMSLHEALGRGQPLPEALLSARQAAAGDPLVASTAHAFVALGA
jgi:tetratricopeptide (TPR) repeat protein